MEVEEGEYGNLISIALRVLNQRDEETESFLYNLVYFLSTYQIKEDDEEFAPLSLASKGSEKAKEDLEENDDIIELINKKQEAIKEENILFSVMYAYDACLRQEDEEDALNYIG